MEIQPLTRQQINSAPVYGSGSGSQSVSSPAAPVSSSGAGTRSTSDTYTSNGANASFDTVLSEKTNSSSAGQSGTLSSTALRTYEANSGAVAQSNRGSSSAQNETYNTDLLDQINAAYEEQADVLNMLENLNSDTSNYTNNHRITLAELLMYQVYGSMTMEATSSGSGLYGSQSDSGFFGILSSAFEQQNSVLSMFLSYNSSSIASPFNTQSYTLSGIRNYQFLNSLNGSTDVLAAYLQSANEKATMDILSNPSLLTGSDILTLYLDQLM